MNRSWKSTNASKTGMDPPDPARRGQEGPVYVTRPRDPIPLTAGLMEATAAAGIPAVEDLNGAAMEGDGGCGIPNVTVRGDTERISMAGAYLRPVMTRPNLTVLLEAEVRRLRFEGTRVVGVEFAHGGQLHQARADCEVILCLGAINTPKILMLSGIGDERRIDAPWHSLASNIFRVWDRIFRIMFSWPGACGNTARRNRRATTRRNLLSSAKATPALPTPDLQPVLEECAFGSELTRM